MSRNTTETGFGAMDYNKEARDLWSRLGIDPDFKGHAEKYQPLDLIYASPRGGGSIYVGDSRAAESLDLLREKGVTAVVNCTQDIPNYHYHTLEYFKFDISWWKRHVTGSYVVNRIPTKKGEDAAAISKKLTDFLRPMLQFIEAALSKGGSVLIHCLAGAHRAGATATICLMHFGGMSGDQAEVSARSLRPVIQLIGDFPELVGLCDKLERGPNRRLAL